MKKFLLVYIEIVIILEVYRERGEFYSKSFIKLNLNIVFLKFLRLFFLFCVCGKMFFCYEVMVIINSIFKMVLRGKIKVGNFRFIFK